MILCNITSNDTSLVHRDYFLSMYLYVYMIIILLYMYLNNVSKYDSKLIL